MGSRSEEGVFEDHGGQIVARSQMNKDGNGDNRGADEVYFFLTANTTTKSMVLPWVRH